MAGPRARTPVVWRRKFITGVTNRSISSTAEGQEGAVVAQHAPTGRDVEERGHGSRDQIAGGLVAGHGEQEEEQLELELGELLPSISTSVRTLIRSSWGSARLVAKSSEA
jgi:hypothetical protein